MVHDNPEIISVHCFGELADDIASTCVARVYVREKLILQETFSAVLGQSHVIDTKSSPAVQPCEYILIVGTGTGFRLYGIGQSSNQHYSDFMRRTENASRKAQTFTQDVNIPSKRYFSCTPRTCGTDSSDSGGLVVTIKSAFYAELFTMKYLLPHYYPGIRTDTCVTGFEVRFVGPTEDGSEICVALSVTITNNGTQSEKKSSSIICVVALHPWIGSVSVVRFCELNKFCSGPRAHRFNSFSREVLHHRIPRSDLELQTDFYVHELQRMDPYLRNYLESSYVVSNIEAATSGSSVMELHHPVLPITIVNDEADCEVSP
jgi:hypothetical protein